MEKKLIKTQLSWKKIVLIFIELIVLLLAVQYIRRGPYFYHAIKIEEYLSSKISDIEGFSLPRGTYIIKVNYQLVNNCEGIELRIFNHDILEAGFEPIVLQCTADKNYTEAEINLDFTTENFMIRSEPQNANCIFIDSIEIEQTSRGKKLDLLRLFFGILIVDLILWFKHNRGEKHQKDVVENERIIWLEFLRIISAIGVIMIHTASAGIRTEAISNNSGFVWFIWYHVLSEFAVPCFFMISGAVFLNPEKELSVSNIIRKYFIKIILMYLFWSGVYALYEMIFEDYAIDIMSFIRKVIRGKDTLWFLPAVAGLYLLVPLMRKFTEDRKLLQYGILLCFIFAWVPSMLSPYKSFEVVCNIISRFSVSVGYAGFFLLGYYFYRYSLDKRQRILLYVLGVLALIYMYTGSVYRSYIYGGFQQDLLAYNSLPIVLYGSFIFILVKQVFTTGKIEEKTEKVIKFAANRTAGIYVVHMFFNNLVFSWLLHCNYRNVWWNIPFTVIVTFVLSLLIVVAIKKIHIMERWLI